MRRAHRAGGIGLVDGIAVIGGIGIDDAADRAVILRELRLQPAPAGAIAGDDDLAFDADTQPLERLVVVLHAVIDIDQTARDIAIALIVDIGGKRGLGRGRAGVAGDRRLLQRGLERFGANKLQALVDRRWIEHPESLDMRVPAPVLEPRKDPLGVGLVVRRADMVGLGGQQLHPVAEVVRLNESVEVALERGLIGRRRC